MASSITVPAFAHDLIENIVHFASILELMSVIGGLGLFVGALFEFKRYGEMRTFMSHQMTIARPLALMLSAIMLLMLPTMIGTLMLAFWGDSSPMAYTPTEQGGWSPLIPVVIDLVRIVGIFSVMRGIFLISRCGHSGGGQPGTLGKAILHMFGGVLCVNVVATEDLIKSILPI